MLRQHVHESVEVAEEPGEDDPEQRPDVHLALLLAQADAQLLAQGRETSVNVANNLLKKKSKFTSWRRGGKKM